MPESSIERIDVNDFFEHHGIKGMHWGVRRGRSSEPASEDATRAANLKSKVKSSGTKSLSNEELQSLVTRMNLESQFKNLSDKHKSAGQKFTDDLVGELKSQGKQEAKAFVKSQTPKVAAAITVAVAKQAVKGRHAA